jgi:4-hydroxy-4-methyl-2-oxoglutarate aldolase
MDNTEIKRMLIERLADSSTALICNAYDFMGLHTPCTDWSIKYMTPEFPPMVGEAITIMLNCSTPDKEYKYEMEHAEDSNLYFKMIERIEKSEIPQIVIIKSLGEKSQGAVIGDGMAKTFLAAGAAGCITDGGVRDIKDIYKAGLKTFGGGPVVNHYALHWSGLGEPVIIGGIKIKTGDIIHGDCDGVIVVPEEGWGKVVRASRYVLDFEKAAHVVLRRTEVGAMEKSKIVGRLSKEFREKIDKISDFEEI